MRSICLFFQVHQPVRLRKFTFFDIGNVDYYYDDHKNETILRQVAESCYLPANRIILDLINKYQGRFKVAFSISGTAIDQFTIYAPDVIESFRELAATGCVEFLAQTYSHSLAILKDKDNFIDQVDAHAAVIESLFGTYPAVFANTGLIYSDEIGARVAEMGYKAALSNSPGHILQWRSPNYLYRNAIHPEFAVLLKNQPLSDDIASRFSDEDWASWPMTAKKFVSWLNKIPKEENVVNLFMDYETFGEHQKKESGILNFLNLLPSTVFAKSDFGFMTPSEIVDHYQAISTINVPFSNSWADNDWNLSACLGNELQQEAFEQLYCLNKMVDHCRDPGLIKDWQYLQARDHFYYMNTNHFSSANVPFELNPYDSPYDAFINYMNVLNDYVIRLNRALGSGRLDENLERNEELISTCE